LGLEVITSLLHCSGMLPGLSEDGSLNVHISRDRAKADSSMMAFIKQHMAEILRPFAENVDMLHEKVDILKEDLSATEQIAQDALDKHIPQGKLIQGVRDDLTVTQRQTTAMKAMLDKLAAEAATLQLDHDEHKHHVSGIHTRLGDTVAHVDKLQKGHDNTNITLSGVSTKLQETREHLQYGVGVQLEKQENHLQNLDAAHQATAQLLASTKRFVDELNENFLMTKKIQDDVNDKNLDQFSRVDTRLAHLSTMLTETINRLNTHANHLRSTNGAVRPMGEKLDGLADSQHRLQMQCKDLSDSQRALRQNLNDFDERLKQLNGQIGEAETSKNIMGADMDSSLVRLAATMTSVQDAFNKHHQEWLPVHEKRMLRLETKNARAMQDIKSLQEQCVGETSPETHHPEARVPSVHEVPQAPVTPALVPQIAKAPGTNMVGAAGAFMGLSNKARLDKTSQQLEEQQQEIVVTHRRLQDAEDDLMKKTQRIQHLEDRLELLGKCVSETKQGLELTEEWWKGLSHGFRETYRSVSIDKEMLPTRPGTALSTRPGTALSMASMATTQSGGPSRPMSARPISARPSRDLSHREPRDRRIHLASLDATPTW